MHLWFFCLLSKAVEETTVAATLNISITIPICVKQHTFLNICTHPQKSHVIKSCAYIGTKSFACRNVSLRCTSMTNYRLGCFIGVCTQLSQTHSHTSRCNIFSATGFHREWSGMWSGVFIYYEWTCCSYTAKRMNFSTPGPLFLCLGRDQTHTESFCRIGASVICKVQYIESLNKYVVIY